MPRGHVERAEDVEQDCDEGGGERAGEVGGSNATERAVVISAGCRHSLVVTAQGALFSFGAGAQGQLGHGDSHNGHGDGHDDYHGRDSNRFGCDGSDHWHDDSFLTHKLIVAVITDTGSGVRVPQSFSSERTAGAACGDMRPGAAGRDAAGVRAERVSAEFRDNGLALRHGRDRHSARWLGSDRDRGLGCNLTRARTRIALNRRLKSYEFPGNPTGILRKSSEIPMKFLGNPKKSYEIRRIPKKIL